VLRHSGQNKLVYPVVGVAMLAVIGYLAASKTAGPGTAAGSALDAEITTQQVLQIMQARCVQCHAAHPTHAAFPSAPAGMALETEQQLLAHSELIKQVVANDYMPLGNLTGMTPAEREVVATWRAP